MNNKIMLTKDLGFLRIACAKIDISLADIDANINKIISNIKQAKENGVQIIAFPELSITGYTIQDLFFQKTLLNKVQDGLNKIIRESQKYNLVIIVGLPIETNGKLYNCAIILNSGNILGIVPKSYLPNYKEYYEDRWFYSGTKIESKTIELFGQYVPFGTDLLFEINNNKSAVFGVELCEDLWLPISPHEHQSLAGATVIFNLSSSNEIIGKADWRKTIIKSESGRCISAYCYVSSGIGESSNDLVFGGHVLIAENGDVLKDSRLLDNLNALIISDIDLDRLTHDRRSITSFHDVPTYKNFRIVKARVDDVVPKNIRRSLIAHPFVPLDLDKQAERCQDIFSMQVVALAKKLSSIKQNKLLIGVSGGLDSTLTLLVAVKTMDYLKLPRSNIYSYNLPGYGTTKRTRSNAVDLSKALGVNVDIVDICQSCDSQFSDLNHEGLEDITFENVQARYRTAFLFNKANQIGGIVLGTGDLTEIALGWNTFSGDHLSHYHINVSVPKTLVRYLIKWVAEEEISDKTVKDILFNILSTPISPELKRPVDGKISQKSEEIIGPVELADFFLYPFIRQGAKPSKILYLANEVQKQNLFNKKYTLEELYRWLKSFIERFFLSQFKRTCMPEGPKIGSVSLSPRGDWRMSSDTIFNLWIEDLNKMYNILIKNTKIGDMKKK